MTVNDLVEYNQSLIEQITTEENTVDRYELLDYVLPFLNSSRLTDSESYSPSFFSLPVENTEVDAYLINETGERLQLFLTNLILTKGNDSLLITKSDYYKNLFLKLKNFSKKAFNNNLSAIQENDPCASLIKSCVNEDFIEQIDTIEMFIITNGISIEPRGNEPSLKVFQFSEEAINVKYNLSGKPKTKKIDIKFQLIDLNKIYNYIYSETQGDPLVIRFDKPLKALKAANEKHYESYLSVIPAEVLAKIYKSNSTRLLERNVRSFLSFNVVNKEMRKTIKEEPEKFMAFNNGLTITATEIKGKEVGGMYHIEELTDFQIVNGGQTTASIYFSAKEGLPISGVNVTAKINIVKSGSAEVLDDLVSKISAFSNSQSRVSNVDLNSRSPYLIRIKKLSQMIFTPAGNKWFFERARGEFITLLKVNEKEKKSNENLYPKEKRLTKEQISKYFVSWGETPFLVRKGGEKVFRDFMELIKKDRNRKEWDASQMGTTFYEDLIAKAILFKEFEKIYGSGAKAIGQIRSAAVPYALSILYKATVQGKSNNFNLARIWREQELPADFKEFSKQLLVVAHDACIKYAKSDDKSEYAKKEELWNDVSLCKEVAAFIKENRQIIMKYSLSEKDIESRYMNEEELLLSEEVAN
ncbi:AIPR protein [Chitinophaga niastensis]|uniref:AIPR protein n=1 Tax=Chitinophaga niastensis TaxID=536980 RepID=A0A2P8HTJ3_CHINA|nr:AIPR family protein [Chitinophaga niastensis]PSL49505.1 AIPR protein [Chitinophaga niastensis]